MAKTDTTDKNHTGILTVLADKFRVLDPTDPTKVLAFDCSSISAESQSDFTIPDSDDTAVFLTATQTLTNKTLTAPTINNAAVLSVDDDNFTITDNADQTKIIAFQASGITTATTRTFTTPDVSATMGITGQSRTILCNLNGKIGGTAGWAVGAANDLGYAGTVPASQTASTYIMQVPYLGVGDTITGFYPIGQIESAANTVTVDVDLRALTNAAGEPTDASVGAMTQISVTADTSMGIGDIKSGLSHIVLATNSYYFLVTVTTGASTDIILQGLALVFTDTSGS